MGYSDEEFLQFVNHVFVAPIFMFLAVLLFVLTGVALMHMSRSSDFIVLACLLFVFGYNSARLGWKMRG